MAGEAEAGINWGNVLKTGAGIASGIGGLMSLWGGSQGGQQQAYDVDKLTAMQQPFMDQYNQIYGQGHQQYQMGQGYMDVGGEQNQLLRQGLMKNLMNSDAIKSMINNRNPYVSSGILQAQNQQSRQTMMESANNQFMQGVQNNMKFGAGLMGQGINTQMGATSGGAGLMENLQQAMISNTDIANANALNAQASQVGMGGSLLDIATKFLV